MEKKQLILASKLALLLGIIGLFVPFFDSSNVIEAIPYFLSEGSAIYKSAGILLLIMICATVCTIALTVTMYFVTKKNPFSRMLIVTDLSISCVAVLSGIAACIIATHLPEEEVELSFGFQMTICGWLLSAVIYLYTILFDENMSSSSEERRAYWLLCLPAIIFYFGVMAFPSIFSVFLSFTNYGGGSLFQDGAFNFVGFKNYVKVFTDNYFYISLKNNFWIVLISVFGQLPLGFFLAYIISRGLVKRAGFYQTMIYLPCVISTVVIGIMFQSFFSANGAWTEILTKVNPAYEWKMSNHPIIPVLFVMLWMYTGTYLIIFLSNLQKIDPAIIEAATIDGATEWQALWHIIFPQLSGVFVISAILAISGSLKSFDLIYAMTGGGPAKQTYVLSLYMFDKAFKGAADYPMANTISTIMVVISLILIAIVKTLEKKFGAKED